MRFEDDFANGKYIAGGAEFPNRWAGKADGLRRALGAKARLGLAYGPGARNWFDLFLPEGQPEGLMIFLHGGYWLAFGPRDFSHLAAGALRRGWACALPAYTLAPEARIGAMVAEMVAALPVMAAEVAGPIAICGHSAGGHLAARLACSDLALADALTGRIRSVVPISPLSDLRPLMETAMQVDLKIDAEEARAQSPALLTRRPGQKVHVWVGGEERPRFRDQARRLGNAWSCPVTVEPGRHHFDVIDGLEDADSALIAALLE